MISAAIKVISGNPLHGQQVYRTTVRSIYEYIKHIKEKSIKDEPSDIKSYQFSGLVKYTFDHSWENIMESGDIWHPKIRDLYEKSPLAITFNERKVNSIGCLPIQNITSFSDHTGDISNGTVTALPRESVLKLTPDCIHTGD